MQLLGGLKKSKEEFYIENVIDLINCIQEHF